MMVYLIQCLLGLAVLLLLTETVSARGRKRLGIDVRLQCRHCPEFVSKADCLASPWIECPIGACETAYEGRKKADRKYQVRCIPRSTCPRRKMSRLCVRRPSGWAKPFLRWVPMGDLGELECRDCPTMMSQGTCTRSSRTWTGCRNGVCQLTASSRHPKRRQVQVQCVDSSQCTASSLVTCLSSNSQTNFAKKTFKPSSLLLGINIESLQGFALSQPGVWDILDGVAHTITIPGNINVNMAFRPPSEANFTVQSVRLADTQNVQSFWLMILPNPPGPPTILQGSPTEGVAPAFTWVVPPLAGSAALGTLLVFPEKTDVTASVTFSIEMAFSTVQ